MVDWLCGPQTFALIVEELALLGTTAEVVTKPTEVVTKPTEVVTKPTEVVTKPTEVVTKPTEVITKPTEVITKPTEVVTKPTEVVTKPTEVITKPTEVITKPTEVITKPTEVITKPTEVITKPTEVVTWKETTIQSPEQISQSSDPEKQIALERAKHTMQLLKDQAISSLKSMNPEFKDKDDDKIFGDLKAKWEKRITDAQDTEWVFKAIESIQKELTKINTEKKFTYVNEKGKTKKEKINKKLTLDTSLDMQEYKSASEKALLYKMNAPVTIDAKTQELREKVKTSGEELSTATIAYKSASETLAGLFEQQATLEWTIVTLESQYTDVTNKITASSKNTVVSTTETWKIKNTTNRIVY